MAWLALVLAFQTPNVQTFKDENFRITVPRAYRVNARQEFPNCRLMAVSLPNLLMAFAAESNASTEEAVASVLAEIPLTSDDHTILVNEERLLKGLKATALKYSVESGGQKGVVRQTVLAHQGYAYRIVGICQPGGERRFEEVYDAFVESFEILGDRADWLAANEGRPCAIVMLGGLVRFSVNRPRWKETTLDQTEDDSTTVEDADFALHSGGAWLYVDLYETPMSLDAFMESVRRNFVSRIPGARATDTAPVTVGGVPGLLCEFKFEWQNSPRLSRLLAVARGGVGVVFQIETVASRQDETRGDWDRLLGSLALEPAGSAAAYPWKARRWGQKKGGEPAALFGVAMLVTRDLPEATYGGVFGEVSPDGRFLFLIGAEAILMTLETRASRQVELPHPAAPGVPPQWSPDGTRILIAGASGELMVLSTTDLRVDVLTARGSHPSFGLDGEILFCENVTESKDDPYNRLVSFDPKSGARRTLVAFPLARIALPRLSPDGAHLALVCNRDYPRTALTGGHVYVANADGTDLRALTKGPEEVQSLAWGPRGDALYYTKRVAAGSGGGVAAYGGRSDLYEWVVATQVERNLSRCDHVSSVSIGVQGLLHFAHSDWRLAQERQGIYAVDPAAAAKAVERVPVTPAVETHSALAALVGRVSKALDGVELESWVPTTKGLERVADAFAKAAGDVYGVSLDFTPDSVDRLFELVHSMAPEGETDRRVILGAGAYYGEVLRRCGGAEWVLRAVPFGRWSPCAWREGNATAEPVLPFSDVVASVMGSETLYYISGDDLRPRPDGPARLMVYPDEDAPEAVRAHSKAYLTARRRIDDGGIDAGLDVLHGLWEARPRNAELARELLRYYRSERPELVPGLLRRSIEAGVEAADLLKAYAEILPEAEAASFYRRSIEVGWETAEVLLKLGRAYEAAGDRESAQAAYRRAARNAQGPELEEARKKLDAIVE